ncbi:glycylpeptide N-tetradecanoyltransferase [Puccinia graminis f. sp. tritici]|uniref:Glycylpeptide N-tetradecanoyltransferase n=1 Tax=Puccinia graminis f. sp. tritici TaxID=56615 RepID=A0A5B0M659_PUCGR|nr:glycylpeptide N-tetradecanoyltransferase [Puccinia graminis f. sp. tritici]KAA1078548.1 glycylpeptide N-tetradecanoyltransferase [Puccinia graminis f. sp. tritici]
MSSEPEDQGVIEYVLEVLRPCGDSESNQSEAQGAQSASSRAGPSSNYSPPIDTARSYQSISPSTLPASWPMLSCSLTTPIPSIIIRLLLMLWLL